MPFPAECDAILEQDELRCGSLWTLGDRCRGGDVEAWLQAAIAAEAFTGIAHTDWPDAMTDLAEAQRVLRRERRYDMVYTSNRPPDTSEQDLMTAAHEAADAEFYETIDHAIRSWEERLALPDEESEMTTKTNAQAVKPLTNGQAAWQCAECETFNPMDSLTCLKCEGNGIPETQAVAAVKEGNAGVTSAALKAPDEIRRVPIGNVVPSPDNPRQHFDETALEQLGKSLRQHTMLQPILVLPATGGRYEIIDGERRYRAAKLARLTAVPVRILDVTVEEAIELRGIANLEREDLTPIEEAQWLQQLVDKCGYTQAALAKRIGRDQSYVSHRLALLKLPADWQAAVMTRAIEPTLARCVFPWLHRPAVIAEALALYQAAAKISKDGEAPSLRDFTKLVGEAIEKHSGSLNEWACGFRVTDKNREALDIEEAPTRHGGTEKRAFNLEAWKRCKAEADKRQKAADKRQRAERSGSAGGDGRGGKKRPYGWDCKTFVQRWLGPLVGAAAPKLLKDAQVRMRLYLLLRLSIDIAEEDRSECEVWEWLCGLDRGGLDKAMHAALSEVLASWTETGTYQRCHVDPPLLIRIASLVGIDYAQEWRPTAELLGQYDASFLKGPAKAAGLGKLPETIDDAWRQQLVDAWPAGTLLPGFELADLEEQ